MNKEIQVKRKKPSGSRYRVLYARTGRKRRLHAATTATADNHAGLGSEVPNIGIGRALMVILLLHVLAIGAIYIHSAFYGEESNKTANRGQKSASGQPIAAAVVNTATLDKAAASASKAAAAETDQVIANPAFDRYIVVTGDRYASIAQNRNVDERALRALNSNRPLRAGVVLDLPAELSSLPVKPAPVAKLNEKPSQKPVQKAAPKKAPVSKAPKAVVLDSGHDVSNAAKAVVVNPNMPKESAASDADTQDSGERYTIQSGDTLWRICNRFKVSRDAVLKINGIEDPNKLYAGRSIKIPAK